MTRYRPSTKQICEWCPHCGKGFYNFYSLADHVKVEHKLTVHRYFGNQQRN